MTRPAGPVFVLFACLALAAAPALAQPGLIVSWGDNLLGQCTVPAPNSDFVSLACGLQHSLGLKADSTLVAWGYNGWGQCDVPAPNSGWVGMAGGGQHSLGLKADGTIFTWGDNTAGQCNLPTPNSGFTAVAAGSTFSLGLKADSTLVAWGANDIGQLNIPQPNSSYVKVRAGYFHALALRADGSLVGWGANQSHQCEPPLPNTGFVAMAAGLNHSVALKADGTVVAWGLNTSGQCNVPQPNSGFVAVAAGWFHSMALRADGTLVAWGNNTYGQADEPSPDAKFLSITSGGWHNLAIQQYPACQVDVAALDFGSTWTGTPAARSVTITNTGGGHLTGLAQPDCAAFQVAGPAGYDLMADQSRTFTLNLLSDTPGSYACALNTGSCDPVALTGTVVPAPVCSLDVSSLDFGTAQPGALVSRQLTVSNVGGDTLSGTLAEDCAAFSIVGDPGFHLAAQEQHTFELRFQSDAIGTFACDLETGACGVVTLAGTVEAPPACSLDATSLDFGLTTPSVPVTRSLTVTNTGGGTLSGVLTEDCPDFEIVSGASYSLAAGQSQLVELRFLDDALGVHSCALSAGVCGAVALSAIVEPAPACALDASSLDFGAVFPDTPVTRSLTVTNVGGGVLSGELSETCDAFAIVGDPTFSLTAGQSRNVQLQFQGGATGVFTCSLAVGACGDVALSGRIVPAPVCSLSASSLDFGTVPPGTPVIRTLTIANVGGDTLSGALAENCAAFSVLGSPSFRLTAGQQQTFALQFLSAAAGVFDCQLSAGSCDAITLHGAVDPPPLCQIDPTALDFGVVLPGLPVTRDLTVTNAGGGLLSVDLSENCAAFSILGDAVFTLAAGQSRIVPLRFLADVPGPYTCSLAGGACGDVTLSGAIEAAPACSLDVTSLDFGVVPPGTLVTRNLTLTNTGGGVLSGELSETCAAFAIVGDTSYNLTAGQSRVVELTFQSDSVGVFACDLHTGACGDVALSGSVEALPPVCSLDVTSLDFGTVLPGTLVTRSLTIINTGGGVLSGELNETCAAFAIIGETTYSLAAGESRVVDINFQSDSAGIFACDLHTGSCGDVALIGSVEAAPTCSLDVTSLDFGIVPPGTLVTRNLTITNTGGGVLGGELSETCAAFAIVGETTYSLAAGQSRVVELTFQSDSTGVFACDLHTESCGDVTLSGAVEAAPACSLDLTSLDFGVVLPGTLVTRNLTITNMGGGVLTGELSEICVAFAIVGETAYSLTAGQSRVVEVAFQSDSVGVFACDLHVGSCGDVALSGSVETLPPVCSLDVTSLDFGAVLPGTLVTRSLTITNTGGGVLSGELSESCAAFAIVGETTYSLTTGQSRVVELTFQSDSAGVFACDLHAGSCGDVTLSGVVEEAPPVCSLDVTNLDFGVVLPGTLVTRNLTITNMGGGVLTGELSEICVAFAIVGETAYSLTAGQSRVVEVAFQSDSVGVFACDLHVGSCGDVALSGSVETLPPVCSLDLTSLDFGAVLPGTLVTRSLTITNTGGGILMGELSEACDAFAIVGDTSYSLTADQNRVVELTFQSDSPGDFACDLHVGSCGDVALSGSVEIAPVCSLDVTSLDFGTVLPGTLVTRNLTITNTGGGVLSGELSETCAAFAIVGETAYSLTAGQSRVVEVTFQSDSPGVFSCDLHTGSCGDVALSGSVEIAPVCSLDVTSLDFGTVLPGTLVTRSLTITNTGGGVLTGELSETCAAFAIVGEPSYSLAAGQSRMVELTFQSDSAGVFACDLHTGTCGDVTLSGAVEAAPACSLDVTSLNFGVVLPGTLVTRNLTITNTGGGVLTGELSETCAAFTIVGETTYSLTAGQSRVVDLTFQSDSTGVFACDLHVGSCGDVALSGAALAVSMATGPASECGLVEDLGNQPGATTGFLVDWNAGLVGLNISPAPPAGVTVTIVVDGAQVWSGEATGAWRSNVYDLGDFTTENRVIHLTLSDGQQTWNATGDLCAWDLRFADLAETLPMSFLLHEAAPNPFNPTTRLQLDLPLADRVELRVLDIQGRLVETLFSGDLPAGRHDFTWQPGRASSGAYFVVARGARDTMVRKVLFLK